MKDVYESIKSILGVEIAAIKLFIIRYGIFIDGYLLADKIEGYPQKYRTKRTQKHTALKNGKLLDVNQGETAFIPEEIFITYNGQRSVVKVNYRKDSIFKLSLQDDSLHLISEELKIDLFCELSAKKDYGDKKIKGKEIDDYIAVLGADRVAVLGFEGCSGWYNNTQCKFCDSCVSREDEVSAIPTLNSLNTTYHKDIDLWLNSVEGQYFDSLYESYKVVVNDERIGPHFHLHVMSGNMYDTKKEWEYMLRLSEVFNRVKPLSCVDSYLNLLPPPTSDFLEKAKNVGYRNLIFNMEVYGDKIYRAVCPEKYEKAPFDHFIGMMRKGVEIFGVGNVRCGFVLGAQPIDALREGCEELAEIGVVSDFTVFTAKKGTPWQNKKGPEIHEVAEFVSFLNSLYVRYGFSPLYCSESSRSAIMNEMRFL